MSGISNISNLYRGNSKDVIRKLSFELGEVFEAKILDSDGSNSDLILKMLDGWEFNAKLDEPLDFLPKGIIKFQVEGFEDGKILLKVFENLNDNKEAQSDSISDIMLSENLKNDDEGYDLLKNMVKHNISLTKKNISEIKTIIDFKTKILSDEDKEKRFIRNFFKSKGIDINSNSKEVFQIEKTLKGFFQQLKNLSKEDILTLFENNIELTEKNIKSFNNIEKGKCVIYKNLKSILLQGKHEIKDNKSGINNINKNIVDGSKVDKKVINKKENIETNKKSFEKNKEISQENKNFQGNKQVTSKLDEDKNSEIKNKDILSQKLPTKGKERTLNSENTVESVKQEINAKVDEIKNIIKNLLKHDGKMKSEMFDKIFQGLQNNINDFKVFNSLSNQYYFMDIPLNIKQNEYGCKLIIKDDRNKGKKIDSKNVKIVATVDTINMGAVDAYIKVFNKNLEVNLKCSKQWIKLLNLGKCNIVNNLSALGYNVFFNVLERKEEVNLKNCRGFFDDKNLGCINVKV